MQIKFFPFLNDLLAHLGVHQSPQWHGRTDRWGGVYIIYIYLLYFRLVGIVVMERDDGEDMRGEIIIKCSAMKNSFVLRTFFFILSLLPLFSDSFCVFRSAGFRGTPCTSFVKTMSPNRGCARAIGGVAINLALIDLKRWN